MNIQNEIYDSILETDNDSVSNLVWGLCGDSAYSLVWNIVAHSLWGVVRDSIYDNHNYVRETIKEYGY
jgi:hypothetical protein